MRGFDACQSAGIEQGTVTDEYLEIRGFYPFLSPKRFIGYYAEAQSGKLYVGFRFTGLFGIFETGKLDVGDGDEELFAE